MANTGNGENYLDVLDECGERRTATTTSILKRCPSSSSYSSHDTEQKLDNPPQRSRSTISHDSGYSGSLEHRQSNKSNIKKSSKSVTKRIQPKDNTESRISNDLQQTLHELSRKQNSDIPVSDLGGITIVGINYVAALLTHIGGYLVIPGKNVSLYVPPDALPECGVHLVYLYIIPSETDGPKLAETQTWLTPLVECGPPGLTFRRNVLLKIPHCRGSSNTNSWKFSAYQATHTTEQRQWERIASESDSHLASNNDTFSLAVSHFTIFGVAGELAVVEETEAAQDVAFKWMKAVVVIEDLEDQPHQKQIRVTLSNSPHLARNVEGRDVNDDLNSDEASDDPTLFCVEQSKGSIAVTISEFEHTWRSIGDSRQIIPYENIWSGYLADTTCHRSVTFLLENTHPGAHKDDTLKGVLIVYQDQHPKRAISIRLEDLPSLKEEADNDERDNRFMMRLSCYNSSIKHLGFLKDFRYRKICAILDGTDNVGKGWQALAPLLGLKSFIFKMTIQQASKYERKSESILLLDDFFEEMMLKHAESSRSQFEPEISKIQLVVDSLSILKDALHEIGNGHAENLIDEELQERLAEMSRTRCGTTKPVFSELNTRLGEESQGTSEVETQTDQSSWTAEIIKECDDQDVTRVSPNHRLPRSFNEGNMEFDKGTQEKGSVKIATQKQNGTPIDCHDLPAKITAISERNKQRIPTIRGLFCCWKSKYGSFSYESQASAGNTTEGVKLEGYKPRVSVMRRIRQTLVPSHEGVLNRSSRPDSGYGGSLNSDPTSQAKYRKYIKNMLTDVPESLEDEEACDQSYVNSLCDDIKHT